MRVNDDVGAPIEPATNELQASRRSRAFLADLERADGTLSRARPSEEEAEVDALVALTTAPAVTFATAPAVARPPDARRRRYRACSAAACCNGIGTPVDKFIYHCGKGATPSGPLCA